VSRTITAPPSGGNPVYNFRRQVTVDPMDANYVQYIQEASLTFEVWSQPSDAQGNAPVALTPEPRPTASTPEQSVVEPEPEPEPECATPVPDSPEGELAELPVPSIDLAAAKVQPNLDALRESLRPLKLSELKKRAAANGISAAQIEGVDDDDDPKAAIIDLLAPALAAEETPREVRLERKVTEAEAQAAEAAARVADLEEALAREREEAAATWREREELASALNKAETALEIAEARLTEQPSSSTCIVS
jgi:hypothetical protein